MCVDVPNTCSARRRFCRSLLFHLFLGDVSSSSNSSRRSAARKPNQTATTTTTANTTNTHMHKVKSKKKTKECSSSLLSTLGVVVVAVLSCGCRNATVWQGCSVSRNNNRTQHVIIDYRLLEYIVIDLFAHR